ncbi:MAG: SDR family oxidoreductase [Marinobacter sp.]|nr:SDR family oxidoreductase [Marinobacter sp.]
MMHAIVTGHSQGLGHEITRALLEKGVRVMGVSRGSAASLQETYPELLQEVSLDFAAAARVAEWLASDAMTTFFSGCDTALLVNNAGVVQPIGAPGALAGDAVARAVQVNVTAPLLFANQFVAATEAIGDRRLAHISSGAGHTPYAGWSTYCATKAALDMHARAVALDNINGLSVVSMAPGIIDTAMQATIRDAEPGQFPKRDQFRQLKTEGRLASPEQVGHRLAAYCLSSHFGTEPVDDIARWG